MQKISLYLDEDVQFALAKELRTRGVDILTTQEGGNLSKDDAAQLMFATACDRVLFSYNKRHFAKLHYQLMTTNTMHMGIILSDQLQVGVLLRRLMKLYFSVTFDDMKNRLEYLSNWR